jgi:hypothetical protein
MNFFCKKADYVKWQEPEPELEPEFVNSRNRSLNLSKVGTGTVKNSYGSATLGC